MFKSITLPKSGGQR